MWKILPCNEHSLTVSLRCQLTSDTSFYLLKQGEPNKESERGNVLMCYWLNDRMVARPFSQRQPSNYPQIS